MKKIRIVALMLSLLVVFSVFTACNKNGESDNGTTTPSVEGETGADITSRISGNESGIREDEDMMDERMATVFTFMSEFAEYDSKDSYEDRQTVYYGTATEAEYEAYVTKLQNLSFTNKPKTTTEYEGVLYYYQAESPAEIQCEVIVTAEKTSISMYIDD